MAWDRVDPPAARSFGLVPRPTPDVRRVALRAAGASTIALFVAFATYRWSVGVAFGMLAIAGVGALLLNDLRMAALAVVVPMVVVEAESPSTFGLGVLYHAEVSKFSVLTLLLVLALAATVLDARRPQRRLRSPRAFLAVLALLLFALIFGIANGIGHGAPRWRLWSAVDGTFPLLALPVVIANAIRHTADLRRAIAIVAALAIAKAAWGVFVVLAGLSPDVEGLGAVSYLAPAANTLEMVYLFGLLAARLQGIVLPRWAAWTWILPVASLALSYRRFFWIAAVFGALLVVAIATRRLGRRMIVPVVLAVGLCGYVVLSTGIGRTFDGSVAKRASTIAPTKVVNNTQDRYRLAERRNVIAALEREPITGLGVGVEWPERYPLPFELTGLHAYTHIALLYWWMTCGPLGALAYLALLIGAFAVGIRVWARHGDPFVRLLGLAGGVGMASVGITELASTSIGPDLRMGAMAGLLLGLLAAAHRGIEPRRSADLA